MNLTAIRALWQMGHLPSERLPQLATDLLIAGRDSRALRLLAGLISPTAADADPLLNQALSDLGVPQLVREEACGAAARELASQALAGVLRPYAAASSLGGLCSDCGWPGYLIPFAAALDEWDDFPSARGEIEEQILDACRAVVAQPGDVSPKMSP
jgi:hypothetical protein